MPRSSIDIGKDRLTKRMKRKVSESVQHVRELVLKPYEPSDKGYGVVYSKGTTESILINYKSTVAMSYQNIDEDINKMYPNLKRDSKKCIRDYIKYLQTQFPKLTDTICENYIKTYELAKFSDTEWTEEMFEEWCGFFRDFTNALTLPSDGFTITDSRGVLLENYARNAQGPAAYDYSGMSEENSDIESDNM